MSDFVLETEQLTKRYGRRCAVEDLCLEVERGDVFGFLGQNGAGKSTTIRMIVGLVRPTLGKIHLLGHDMSLRPMQALRRIGAIVEAPAFYEQMSGFKNLKLLAAMSGGASNGRIEEALDIVGLRARSRDPVREYSHGMRQRLGIAQALLPSPEFIILDEPTDGLDPQGIQEVRILIRRLRDDLGLTVLLSSHLLFEVEQICNRVAIIDHGKLLYQGTIDALVTAEKTVRITVDRLEEAYELLVADAKLSVSRNGNQSLYIKMSDEQIPAVNQLLVERGFRVSELALQRETLEDVFIRLTRPKVGTDRYIQ
jgi:ABC-2 type transport system ATP-binding protein